MIDRIKFFKDKPLLAEIIDLLILCLITVIIGKLITTFLILPGHVPTSSMETTIMTDDRMLTNLTAYWGKDPQRGDIVVFDLPDDKAKGKYTPYVKRIIGLPGDKVEVKDGSVYINDELLEEPYLNVSTNTGEGIYHVEENSYFMMGDNRNDSYDSRGWKIKCVPRDEIKGKVFFKYSLSLKNLHAKVIHSHNDYNI